MTDIKHHLTDALLMAYSAGTLPEGFNLIVATHISMCDECRARLMAFDSLGGAVLEDEAESPLAPDSLSATLQRIRSAEPAAKDTSPVSCAGAIFPAPLRDYVGGDLDAVKWRKVGGGVRQAMLDVDKSSSVRLLHIPAGTAVPDHGHRGTELTLVLQGAFRDEVDHFARGDIEVATEALDHQPVADEGQDCICLAATDAPLRFNTMIPRMLQPFLRI